MSRLPIIVLFWLTACGADPTVDDDPRPDAGPQIDAGGAGIDALTADARPADDASPGSGLERCGLDDFAWRPAAEVGAVVASQKEHDVDQAVLWVLQAEIESRSGVSLERIPDHDVDMRTIRYTTQDRGVPIEATGMVIHPDVTEPTEFPVILWMHGTSGANDECGPSVGIDDAESDNGVAAMLLALFASYGYIVVAPDYIGMKASGFPSTDLHPYLVGEPTAIAGWDAVRAAEALLASETSGEVTAGRIAVWGASQGGHAAAFTVRFGPHYAPEYDVVAGVYAIPPSDLIGHAEAALTQVQSATGNITVHLATAEQWYRVPNGMTQVFRSPFDVQLQPDLKASCAPDTLDDVTALDQLFTPAALAAAQIPGFGSFAPWACILRENSLTTTSVERLEQVPALFILAENDSLVDPGIERAAFSSLCSSGMRLQYLECQGANHTEGFYFAIDDAFDFIEERLAGTPLPSSVCQLGTAQVCSSTP